jgi:hypothetical protein
MTDDEPVKSGKSESTPSARPDQAESPPEREP